MLFFIFKSLHRETGHHFRDFCPELENSFFRDATIEFFKSWKITIAYSFTLSLSTCHSELMDFASCRKSA